MSYLTLYALRRPASVRPARPGTRVDEKTLAEPAGVRRWRARARVRRGHVGARVRRRRLPSPRLKLRIADCSNEIHLEFSVDSADERENSLHKIDTLIAALKRFRSGLRRRRSSASSASAAHDTERRTRCHI